MFGAFKKLFSKSAQPETVGRTAQTLPSRPAFVPTPAHELAPEAPMATSPQQAVSTGDAIHIPLTAIVPKLPGHLARLAIRAGMGTLDLPVATALEQLPSGRVRIPFGQLRKGVPSGTFADNETHDDVMIELPLSPILTGMNPALLARKAQKHVKVPDEVLGVFGPQGSISARVAKDVASASAMPANSPAAATVPPASPPPAVAPVRAAPAMPTAPRVTAIPVVAPPASAPIAAPRPTPITPISPISPIAAPVTGSAAGPIRVPISPKPAAPAASNPLPFAQRAEALLAQRLPAMGIKPPAPAPAPPPPVAITPISPIAPEPEIEEEVETEVEAEQPEVLAPVATPFAPVVMPKAPTVGDVVPIPLSDISENWPDPVRQEIAHGEWDMSMVVFPINRLEAGMKSGKISFTWGEIRLWLNPPIGSIHSQQVDVQVELPLKVVAPLFLAARRPMAQRKTDFDETIPDVFTGLEPGAAVKHPPVSARPGNTEMFRNAAAAAIPAGPVRTGNTDLYRAPLPPPTPVAPPPPVPVSTEVEVEEVEEEVEEEVLVPAPAPVAAPAPAPAVSGVPRPDPLGSIFGMPLKSDWTPAEIAQKVCELTGISGGVITTADGLPIAGNVEEPQKVETLAAFLPQIFARLNQYAGEMEIGLLTSLNMTTAEAPCAIYKCGKLYLGVVGRFGQTLPDSHLRRIAAEIAKRNP